MSRRLWNSGWFRVALVALVAVGVIAVVNRSTSRPSAAKAAAANRATIRRLRAESERLRLADLRNPVVRRERAKQREEQKPHYASARPGLGSRAGQQALVAALERSITRDGRARFAAGTINQQVHDTVCMHLVRPNTPRPPPPPLSAVQAGYECTAITSRAAATSRTEAAIIGYPYWARVYFRTGRYAWCKITLLPAEHGVSDRDRFVPLDPVCDVLRGQGPA